MSKNDSIVSINKKIDIVNPMIFQNLTIFISK